jgi:4-cresol dehydrogenase (hydroxylating) flavoprotein subunit
MSLEQAKQAFVAAVGREHVFDDDYALARAAAATFATTQRILAIVRPASTDEVRACVIAARQHGVSLYAVSGGKNWGLGSRVPPRDAQVLLDLGRMKQIVELDETLAFVTLEPGVTFQELHDHLRAKAPALFASTTGSSPHGSVIGNTLERGDGAGPYGDRANHVCALEVVLGTGEVVRTGFARFPSAKAAALHRFGVGPALDGLFSQSGLGIVTRMTLWLTPRPRSLHAVRFSIVDAGRLGPLVDALRVLRLEGTLRSVIGLWNDYRVLSTRGQYPWQLTGNRTPLPRSLLAELASEWGNATWFGATAIYAASAELGRAARAEVERVLAPLVDDLVFDERAGAHGSGREPFADADPALSFAQGIPHEASLRSVYWRKRFAVPDEIDPDRDRCGVVWLCPVLPLAGADVGEAAAFVESAMLEHGFEPMIAMVAQSERCLYLMPLLLYDRDVEGEDERAMACHDALFAELAARGYFPYRLGIHSMQALPASFGDYDAVMSRLEHALDPAGVIAPGRYSKSK